MEMKTLNGSPIENGGIPYPTGLTLATVDFLNMISYKVMRTEEELDQVFRLRHDTYQNAGYLEGNDERKFRDELDETPNVYNVGVYLNGELSACSRFHVLTPDHRQSCATGIFPKEVHEHLDNGETMIDTSRFCCNPELASRYNSLPLAVIRVAGLLVIHANAQWSLATVTRGHVPFYKRVLGAKSWHDGGVAYHGLDRDTTIHLLAANTDYLYNAAKTKQQYFLSSQQERDALFGGTEEFVRPSAMKILTGEVIDPFWTK